MSIFSIGGSESSGAFGVSTSTDRGGLGSSKTTTLVLRTDEAGYQALAKAREIGDLDLTPARRGLRRAQRRAISRLSVPTGP